jgi:ABC-type multidrug transport system fused ATPase/permease subunit
VTFVIFVVVASFNGQSLDTETAFTTTAVLGLVTHPANMIMSIIPQAVGSLAAFERIQDYLLQKPRNDKRIVSNTVENNPSGSLPAICIKSMTIRAHPSTAPIIEDVSLTISSGSVVFCSGPSGSGKTMLIKSLLGEVAPAGGKISVSSTPIAYCEQSPWLPSGTIREAIFGFSPRDLKFYKEVIRLCCLDKDLLSLPAGDDTVLGSRGLNLSGGQRQRVVSFSFAISSFLR